MAEVKNCENSLRMSIPYDVSKIVLLWRLLCINSVSMPDDYEGPLAKDLSFNLHVPVRMNLGIL